MSEMLARYSMREKLIVGVALLVLLLIGGHAMLVEPYLQRVASVQEAIEQERADLGWMQSAVTRIPRNVVAGSGTTEISGTLANFIDRAVRSQNLTGQLSQMSPVGEDEIRMRYSDVDFNRLVAFIASVNASGLKVKDIRISPSENAGSVNSSLVLERRG